MQVLMILSQIWKSGANIYLDTDDRVAIKNQNLIPAEVMQAAEQNFQSIDDWFKSWKGAGAEQVTIRKALHYLCNWEQNEKLNKWMCEDTESALLLIDWTEVLANNGWKDIYEDYRQFENDESNKLAKELYINAVTYAKKGAGA
ncbi:MULTISPECIES: hypothetical protein [Cytobacillus]|nr:MULTISPECIES: hypothetical protein [Cytobacillus]